MSSELSAETIDLRLGATLSLLLPPPLLYEEVKQAPEPLRALLSYAHLMDEVHK